MDDRAFVMRVAEVAAGLLVLAALGMFAYLYWAGGESNGGLREGQYDFGPAPELQEDKQAVLGRLEEVSPAASSSSDISPSEKAVILKKLEQNSGAQAQNGAQSESQAQSNAEKIKLLESLGR